MSDTDYQEVLEEINYILSLFRRDDEEDIGSEVHIISNWVVRLMAVSVLTNVTKSDWATTEIHEDYGYFVVKSMDDLDLSERITYGDLVSDIMYVLKRWSNKRKHKLIKVKDGYSMGNESREVIFKEVIKNASELFEYMDVRYSNIDVVIENWSFQIKVELKCGCVISSPCLDMGKGSWQMSIIRSLTQIIASYERGFHHMDGCNHDDSLFNYDGFTLTEKGNWFRRSGRFTDRELSLIDNSIQYANGDPAGLPGHNLMMIIAKYQKLLVSMIDNKSSKDDNGGDNKSNLMKFLSALDKTIESYLDLSDDVRIVAKGRISATRGHLRDILNGVVDECDEF